MGLLGLYWGYIRVILGLLGLYWGYIRVILGLYWGYVGLYLGYLTNSDHWRCLMYAIPYGVYVLQDMQLLPNLLGSPGSPSKVVRPRQHMDYGGFNVWDTAGLCLQKL